MVNTMIRKALFIFAFIFASIQAQNMELLIGHVVFRHGDRTPVGTFPTDPTKEADWPNGFGQLTFRGIQQHHKLGLYIRRRYASILNTTYVQSEISVRSTDFDRTLMSAEANLAGLYPDLYSNETNVPFQPIPIHTVPTSEDFLLGQNSCPRYDELELEIEGSPEVQKLDEQYKDFFLQLSNWTGFQNITVYNAWDIADTIFVEHIYNRTPAWATDDVRDKLAAINELGFHLLYANNDTRRIRGGPLVEDIWNSMNNTIGGKSKQKLRMYSAHDTTVSAVLAFLGINYPHQPQYASALFIDLYKTDSTYFVKVEYVNVTDSEQPFSYKLDGCPNETCPFDTFTTIYQERFPSTAEKECATSSVTTTTMGPMPPTDGDDKNVVIGVSITIAVLVICIVGAFWYMKRRRASRDEPLLNINPNYSSA